MMFEQNLDVLKYNPSFGGWNESIFCHLTSAEGLLVLTGQAFITLPNA